MRKYILCAATCTLLITSATAQNVKDVEKMRTILPKTPPVFLSKSEKLKTILSPGFEKPATIPKFSPQSKIDDNSYTLSSLSLQTDLFGIRFINSFNVDYQGASYNSGQNNSLQFLFLQNQQSQEIYLFEINIYMYPAGKLIKSPIFSIHNNALGETETVPAQQVNGYNYKLLFTCLMQYTANALTVSCADPNWSGWTFLNSEITKVSQ